MYLDPDQSTTDLISSMQAPVHVVFVCMLCYLQMAAWKKRSMTGTTSLEEKYKAKIYTGCLSLKVLSDVIRFCDMFLKI